MKKIGYRRLSCHEREEISKMLTGGCSLTFIAKELGRNVATVSRELARNGGRSRYRAFLAENRSRSGASARRRGGSKLLGDVRLRGYVHEGLAKKWSPREVVRRMEMEYPHDMTMRISHEAIYRYIYVLPRGSLKKELISALRMGHKYRRKHGKRRGTDKETRGKIADMLSIEERPREVEDRIAPGHWEGDLILGKHKRTAIGTLVERTTRYTVIVPLPNGKDAISVGKAYAKAFRSIPKELAKTLTYDQGKEMSRHALFTVDTGMKVYFAHPAAPWERGTNENTNGLIRQYFPKGTEFDKVTTREIRRVQRELNDRPRAALNFYKPDEKFKELVALKV